MTNYLRLTATIYPAREAEIGFYGPTKVTPMPRNRAELSAQMDTTFAEIKTALLNAAFPVKIEAGDDARGNVGGDD